MIILTELHYPRQFREYIRVVRSSTPSMYLRSGLRWSLYRYLSYLCLLLAQALAVNATIYCSERNFGRPSIESCNTALEALPMDTVLHFFVEQHFALFYRRRVGLPSSIVDLRACKKLLYRYQSFGHTVCSAFAKLTFKY